LRFERLGFQAVLQRGPALGFGDLDVLFAGGIEALSVPLECVGFFDSALHIVSERARPVDGELGFQFVADADSVAEAVGGILANLRRFGSGAGGENGMMERLRRHHRAL
jgi:hypothetical protein